MHIVACYMDKKTNNFLLIFICLRGKKDFLSANIFCGVFEKKKKTVERMEDLENTYFKQLDKDS